MGIESRIEENKTLSQFSTFGIGGPARYFIAVHTLEELQEALHFSTEKGVKVHVIGKGSNSLFSDRGFSGLAILNKIDFFDTDGNGLYTVGAGYSFALLGQKSARDGFSGLEFALGIPAAVGGAIFMNAGAQNQETKDCLVWVDYMDLNGHVKRLKRDDISFGYRKSSFQEMKGVIVLAGFQTSKDQYSFERQREMVDYRLKSQPYKDKSCGCVFRNPLEGSAGALIDRFGLKGLRVGGAEVSQMHGNFIVNKDGATCHDVLTLMNLIQEKIRNLAGIELESEIRVIGE